ncbi:MAG: nucleoside-diphosphate kinase [Actinomycetota bacterium]|nr:nucleoside-diphosphate kinase [Actinomycetota bacterium]
MSDCSDCKFGCGANQIKKEKTLIIIKPDAVRKKLIGEIISRFEKAGFLIEKLKMMEVDKGLACSHYVEHEGRPYFDRLINYVTSYRCVVMVVSRVDAIVKSRKLMGCTDSTKAEKGTIRGDYGEDITINVVHGSDSLKSAEREIKLFFG